ncbi:MAG: hypothetical protein Roseis2KO_23590 [Roseivirga sp.]
MIMVLLLFSGCKSVQLNSGVANTGTIDLTNASSMNKDAMRITGRVEQVNEAEDKENSYDLIIEKIVKYGATFSSVEPKTGEVIRLSTPLDVSLRKGDVILVDILTPRIDPGEKPLKVRMG